MRRLAPLVVLLGACTSTAEVPWDVRVDDPALAARAAHVETSVRRGGCEGVLVYRAAIAADRRGPPPALGRGLHGFAAEARDAECRPIARACVERDLPLPPGARVELVLEPAIGEPACPADRCSAGACAEDDAGTIDPPDDAGDPLDAGIDRDAAPIDAAPADASMPDDAGSEPGSDAGPEPDAGPPPACDGATFGAHCYRVETALREWSDAETACVGWGGHLVSLGGPEETAFVHGLTGSTAHWIGLHDLTVEGIWQWVDGSTSSYREWQDETPANRDQNDCVLDRPGTGWSVVRCRETHPAICER